MTTGDYSGLVGRITLDDKHHVTSDSLVSRDSIIIKDFEYDHRISHLLFDGLDPLMTINVKIPVPA